MHITDTLVCFSLNPLLVSTGSTGSDSVIESNSSISDTNFKLSLIVTQLSLDRNSGKVFKQYLMSFTPPRSFRCHCFANTSMHTLPVDSGPVILPDNMLKIQVAAHIRPCDLSFSLKYLIWHSLRTKLSVAASKTRNHFENKTLCARFFSWNLGQLQVVEFVATTFYQFSPIVLRLCIS